MSYLSPFSSTSVCSSQNGARSARELTLKKLLKETDAWLDDPIKQTYTRNGVEIILAGGLGYRVDRQARDVLVLVPHKDGVTEFAPCSYGERPLVGPNWLVFLIRKLHLCEAGLEIGWFLSPFEMSLEEQWLASRAYRVLRLDGRFRELVTRGIPRALGLEPDLCAIACRARRRALRTPLSLRNLKLVWRFEHHFRRVARENPELLPLLAATISDGMLPLTADPVKELKELVLNKGLSQAAWRYVTRHGQRLFAAAWERSSFRTETELALDYLRALDSAGLPPPPSAAVARIWARQAASGARDPDYGIQWDGIPAHVIGTALREAKKRGTPTSNQNFLVDLGLVLDWVTAEKPEFDKQQRRAGWPWLLRKALAWYQYDLLLELHDLERWESLLGPFAIGPYSVEPITDSLQLIDESIAFRNCLPSYHERLRDGLCRLFVVHDCGTGHRLAIVELKKEPGRGQWLLGEVRGPANGRVSPSILQVSKVVLSRFKDSVGIAAGRGTHSRAF